jgi:large subunit ribosomal protein L29
MEAEKYRNLGDDELALEARKTAEQLFRLRFQMKLGQTEGVKKLRELRRDVARIRTVERERQLGLHPTPASKLSDTEKPETSAAAEKKPVRKKAAKPARKRVAKKATGARKSGSRGTSRRPAARPSASKKKAARSSSVKKG